MRNPSAELRTSRGWAMCVRLLRKRLAREVGRCCFTPTAAGIQVAAWSRRLHAYFYVGELNLCNTLMPTSSTSAVRLHRQIPEFLFLFNQLVQRWYMNLARSMAVPCVGQSSPVQINI